MQKSFICFLCFYAVRQQWTLQPARGTCSKLIVAFPTGGDSVVQEDNMARENNTAFQTSDSCDPIDTSTPELI
jgi:hypothetical protein